jgi:phosphoglycerol transferase MdoB-like AlkP superfamily enzyme
VHALGAALLFLGMRGRVDEKAPLQPGTAYFSDDPFLNQLGLNAAFSLGASLEKRWTAARRRVQLMEPAEAFFVAGNTLGAPHTEHADIGRTVHPTGDPDRLNVVIVLLESMSMHKLGLYGGPTGLTPFLNALKPVSLSCERAFSAGIHTYNGIHSTLYGYPALLDQQPLEDWLDKRQTGLPGVLRGHGYRTLFCTTHDPEFDNMKGFLTSHGFERVISEDDYPGAWVQSTNGVPDHRMFDFALPELDALAAQGPFLSVFMTTSDHKPYILPDSLWFNPRSERLEDRIVEYVDASLGRFIAEAAKRPWGRRTLFVLLGDHGINMGHTYDLPLTFHHTPLLLHTPGGQLSPGLLSAPCGQIDVPATVLGVLNLPWTNTTMGVDVRRSPRACTYFCADDRVGCIDEEYYFIRHADGRETLHHHPDLDMRDLAHERPARLDSLRRYAYAMLQVTQELVDHDLLDGPAPPTP